MKAKESNPAVQIILIATVVLTLVAALVGSHIMRMNSLPFFLS